MPEILDLEPAVNQLTKLVGEVTDDQLSGPTPCAGITIRGLLAHVQGLALAFREAAGKSGSPAQDGAPGPAELDDDWRTLIPARLAALAAAWREPEAWEGTTKVGGLTLPGAIAGQVAADELVIHGWDLARSIRQPFSCDPASLQASLEFVTRAAQESEGAGTEGLFGPVVEVPAEAPVIDRIIGLSGRDPSWVP
jgi:uncharacterized protein (TIGR03086 family)